MALTIKSSALTGRIVPFFISSCSDRSSRLIANRKLGNKVLRQISFPHSLVRISLYINKGSSGLAVKRSKCASMKHFIFSKKGSDSSTRERNVSASCLAFSSNTLFQQLLIWIVLYCWFLLSYYHFCLTGLLVNANV